MHAGNEDDCFVIEQIAVSDSDDEPEFCEQFAVTLNDGFDDLSPAKVFTADANNKRPNIRTRSPTLEESSEEEMEKSDTVVEVGRRQAFESSENSGDELSGKNGNTKDLAKARRHVPKLKAARRSRIKQEVKKEPTNSEKMRLKIEKVETLKRDGTGTLAEIRQQPSVSVPAHNPVATDGSGGQCTGYVLVPIQMPFPMMSFGGMMPIFASCQLPATMMTPQAVMAAQSFMELPACQTTTSQLAAFQPTGQLMVQPTATGQLTGQPTGQLTVQPIATGQPIVQPAGPPALHPTAAQPPAESTTTTSVDKPSSAVDSSAPDSSAVECVLTTDEDLTDWKLCATTVVNLCQKNRCASNSDSLNDTDARDHFQDCDDGFVYDSDASASPRKVHSSPQKKRSLPAAANKQYKCTNCGKKFKYRFSPRRRIEIALGRHFCEECVGKMAEPREPVGRSTALRSGKKPVDGLRCDKLLCSTDAVGSGKPVIRLKPPGSSESVEKFTDEVRVKLERLDDVETVKKSRATRSTDGVCVANGAKPFETEIFCCMHCDKKFSHALSLLKHSKKHGKHSFARKCRVCGKQFENLGALNAHSCGEKSTSSDSLKLIRSRDDKDENKHKCAGCRRLCRKLRSFSGEKQFRCVKCRQKDMKQSQETSAGKSKSLPQEKDDTHKSSSKTATATPHRTPTKPLKCLKCFRTFRRACNLATHMKSKHRKKSK